MAERICRLRSLLGAGSDIGYTTHHCNTNAMILCAAGGLVKLVSRAMCYVGELYCGAGFSLWVLAGEKATLPRPTSTGRSLFHLIPRTITNRFARAATGRNNQRREFSIPNKNRWRRFRLRDGRCRFLWSRQTEAEFPLRSSAHSRRQCPFPDRASRGTPDSHCACRWTRTGRTSRYWRSQSPRSSRKMESWPPPDRKFPLVRWPSSDPRPRKL